MTNINKKGKICGLNGLVLAINVNFQKYYDICARNREELFSKFPNEADKFLLFLNKNFYSFLYNEKLKYNKFTDSITSDFCSSLKFLTCSINNLYEIKKNLNKIESKKSDICDEQMYTEYQNNKNKINIEIVDFILDICDYIFYDSDKKCATVRIIINPAAYVKKIIKSIAITNFENENVSEISTMDLIFFIRELFMVVKNKFNKMDKIKYDNLSINTKLYIDQFSMSLNELIKILDKNIRGYEYFKQIFSFVDAQIKSKFGPEIFLSSNATILNHKNTVNPNKHSSNYLQSNITKSINPRKQLLLPSSEITKLISMLK